MRKATIKIMRGRNVLLSGVFDGDATDEQLFELEQAINGTAFRCHIDVADAVFPLIGSTVKIREADLLPTYEGVVERIGSNDMVVWLRVEKINGVAKKDGEFLTPIPMSIANIIHATTHDVLKAPVDVHENVSSELAAATMPKDGSM